MCFRYINILKLTKPHALFPEAGSLIAMSDNESVSDPPGSLSVVTDATDNTDRTESGVLSIIKGFSSELTKSMQVLLFNAFDAMKFVSAIIILPTHQHLFSLHLIIIISLKRTIEMVCDFVAYSIALYRSECVYVF